MAALTNTLHERFAQNVARGLNGTKAAVEAGYGPNNAAAQACKLQKRDDVKERIAELRAASERAVVQEIAADRAWVMQKLVANVDGAQAAGNLNAMNRALELIGKELGMFVDRTMEVKSPLDGLSATQLQALVQYLGTVTAEQDTPQEPLN
ncbi:hypothetical protein CRT60_22690 [Azospirillum palustre]|uniref:Terminase n=1 Tax=Azospirillum palustre TaxID=2044885 RepID=A0A2B8B667_9PROT|nr:terminase small subunit [Azospirillum palustre]PGH52757.1 hypothetical protein CRT60_22690 [Azospirillum palustre]